MKKYLLNAMHYRNQNNVWLLKHSTCRDHKGLSLLNLMDLTLEWKSNSVKIEDKVK